MEAIVLVGLTFLTFASREEKTDMNKFIQMVSIYEPVIKYQRALVDDIQMPYFKKKRHTLFKQWLSDVEAIGTYRDEHGKFKSSRNSGSILDDINMETRKKRGSAEYYDGIFEKIRKLMV